MKGAGLKGKHDVKSFELKGKQALFYHSKARYPALFGSYRAGKTVVACIKGINLCLKYPGIVGAVVRNSYNELNSSTKKIFVDLLQDIDDGRPEGQKIIKRRNDQLQYLKLWNGSEIFFFHTSNPALFKGPEFGWFVIDQAEEVNEEIANRICTRLSQPDVPQVGMFIGNTNKGHNWCYRWFKQGQKESSELFEITIDDNRANLNEEYYNDMMNMPDDWKKVNLYASWDEPGGLVLELNEEHFLEPFIVPKRWFHGIAFDPPESTGTCAALAFAIDFQGNYYICNEYYSSNGLIKDHAQSILELWSGMQNLIIADPLSWRKKQATDAGFVLLSDRYGEYGVNAIPAENAIAIGLDRLREMTEKDKNHKHPITGKYGAPWIYFFKNRLPNLFTEMNQWMMVNPEKEPVHACDCLRYIAATPIPRPSKVFPKRKSISKINGWLRA